MTDSTALTRLREYLAKEAKISIFIRKNPDIDTLAAALSFYLSFQKAGKTVSVFCPTEPLVEHATLVGIDKVSKTITSPSGKDLTVILPYEKGKIEKISYNIEGDKIHLVVKAGPDGLGFTPEEISFLNTGGEEGLVLLIGVTSLEEDLAQLYQKSLTQEKVFNLSDFAEERASSISETAANLLSLLAAPLDVDIAQNLLNGISFATNNFQSSKTTPLSFEMAAVLLRFGAKREGQEIKGAEPPSDWLTPKIYKGSTLP